MAKNPPPIISALAHHAADPFRLLVQSVVDLMGGWGNVIKALAAFMALKFVVQVISLGASIAAVIPTVVSLTKVVATMMAGFLTTPIGLLVAALVGAAAVVLANWEPIKKFFDDVWSTIKRVAGAVGEFFGFGSSSTGVASGSWAQPTAAAPVANAIAGRGGPYRDGLGGTLRIFVDADGRPRVRDLAKKPGSPLELDVYSGPALGLQ